MPIAGISIWVVAKLFVLLAFLVYVIFAGVVARQVHLMTETLETGFEAPVRLIVWLHLAIATISFLFAILVL